jgi:hypothetical protein
VSLTKPHQVEYKGELIKVWQAPTGRWQCCIVATGSQDVHGIGPDVDEVMAE